MGSNNKTSNNNGDGKSAGDDWDGRGHNGRKTGWEEDNSRRSNGKNKFELDNNDGAEGGEEGQRDNNKDYINKDDGDYDVGWGSGPANRPRAATSTTLADNHVLDNNNLQQDSNENKNYNHNDGGGCKTIIKKGQRLTSSGNKGIQDLLNTIATTTNLTMNVKGKMQMMTSSMPHHRPRYV